MNEELKKLLSQHDKLIKQLDQVEALITVEAKLLPDEVMAGQQQGKIKAVSLFWNRHNREIPLRLVKVIVEAYFRIHEYSFRNG